MKILTLSARRTDFEFEVFEMPSEIEIIKGTVSGIGNTASNMTCSCRGKSGKEIVNAADFRHLLIDIDRIIKRDCIANGLSGIDAVGHRVIHGGRNLLAPVRITPEVMAEITNCVAIAPLHNPSNIECIEAAMEMMPDIPHIAVFDTAFHSTIPEHIRRYAIPEEVYLEQKMVKYGFHGISHEYIVEHTSGLAGIEKNRLNMISCHLGRGGSVNAIKNGKSFDISMGFTPLDGLIMSTRCGEIDPGAVLYLLKSGMSLSMVETMLLKRSGLLGLSGMYDNMQDILEHEMTDRTSLIIDMYAYRVRKYLGAYLLNLGKIEALSFTGGIGVNSPVIRAKICENLSGFGIELDEKKNSEAVGIESEIGAGKIRVFVIPRNEKLMMARYVARVING